MLALMVMVFRSSDSRMKIIIRIIKLLFLFFFYLPKVITLHQYYNYSAFIFHWH